MSEIDDGRRTELIPCKVEERDPDVPWYEYYRFGRQKGISPDDKSFLFKLIHTLLPSISSLLPPHPSANVPQVTLKHTNIYFFNAR